MPDDTGTENANDAAAFVDEALDKQHKPKQADILIAIAADTALFHTDDNGSYADITIGGHRETWPVKSRKFKQWLARKFYEKERSAPSAEALQAALTVIEGQALFDGPTRSVHVRIAGHGGKIYVDLGDPDWRAVEISAAGWIVVVDPPVRFRRPAGLLSLPMPVRGGSISDLRKFLNVADDGEFVLAVAWLIAALRNRGPYPVLALLGEQGSAKSSFAGMLRAIVDPNKVPLRAPPRNDLDLFIAATNGHLVVFDNLSGLHPWLSDTLCRLATGGGFSTRQLYTDQDETLFSATRPIILTGIEDVVTRGDLADRSIFLRLQPIPDDRRRDEEELLTEFNAALPGVFGALLDAVAYGLRELPNTRLDRLPRMADFAKWVAACEGALWPPGTFTAAYNDARDDITETVIEADTVATTVRSMMRDRDRKEWTGTATDLLAKLREQVSEAAARDKSWPQTPRALSGRLRRAAPNLREVGIDIVFGERDTGRKRDRMITVRGTLADKKEVEQPSATSEPSAAEENEVLANDLSSDGLRTQEPVAEAPTVRADDHPASTVRSKSFNNNAADGADRADAKSSTAGSETPAAWKFVYRRRDPDVMRAWLEKEKAARRARG